MRKIISLFKRDYDGTRLVYDEIVPGAGWVVNGEGVATVKLDGTACMIRNGRLYKRYDVKKGRTAPPDFEAAQDPDEVTGHWPGWLPVGDGAEDRWHREAFDVLGTKPEDGTYELIGPKVQGNPYDLACHKLVPHGATILPGFPRTFQAIRDQLACSLLLEGVVWHHPDGRMVKIKRKDFGLPWPALARSGEREGR